MGEIQLLEEVCSNLPDLASSRRIEERASKRIGLAAEGILGGSMPGRDPFDASRYKEELARVTIGPLESLSHPSDL